MNARTNLKPIEAEPIRVGRALRQSANERFSDEQRDQYESGLDATESGKQERDQMSRELWGDE